MTSVYADARFDDLNFDTRSQWIGRGKQYLSYGIKTAHDGRLMHDISLPVHFDGLDLVLDFENVCNVVHLVFFLHCINPLREIRATLPGYGFSSRENSAPHGPVLHVHAGVGGFVVFFRVSAIHRTLTWTAGSFTFVC